MTKIEIETSYQVFINGEPEPVKIVDINIDENWDKKRINNTIARAVYRAIKELQRETVGAVQRLKQ